MFKNLWTINQLKQGDEIKKKRYMNDDNREIKEHTLKQVNRMSQEILGKCLHEI